MDHLKFTFSGLFSHLYCPFTATSPCIQLLNSCRGTVSSHLASIVMSAIGERCASTIQPECLTPQQNICHAKKHFGLLPKYGLSQLPLSPHPTRVSTAAAKKDPNIGVNSCSPQIVSTFGTLRSVNPSSMASGCSNAAGIELTSITLISTLKVLFHFLCERALSCSKTIVQWKMAKVLKQGGVVMIQWKKMR